jgi:hypothetical protein
MKMEKCKAMDGGGPMTESEIQCLKSSVNKNVEIETAEGELLVAKVLFVTNDDDYDEHELLYQVVASSKPEFYERNKNAPSLALDFENILSVKPRPDFDENGGS